MTRFVLLLLGARLRLMYNSFRRGKTAAKIGWIVAGVGLFVLAGFSGFAGYGLARVLDVIQEPRFQESLLEVGVSLSAVQPDLLLRSTLSLLVLAVWGIVLLSSLGAAVGNFYLAGDLDLLVAAPIPMRAIFAAKFLEGLGVGYLLLFTLGGPALFGLGIGAGYAWPYFAGAVLILVVLPLVPESLGTLLVMPLVRIIPPKRLREALQALGAMVGAAFYFFSQLPRGGQMDPQAAGQLVQWLNRLDLPFLPQGWAAHGLISLGEGDYLQALVAVALFVCLSLGLYALCLIGAERLYYSGWASLQAAPAAARPRRGRHPRRPAREVRLFPRQIQAILAKDLRLFLRDPRGWTQMLMPLAVYALLVVQMVGGGLGVGPGGRESTVLTLSAIVVFLSTSMLSRLGLGGIGSEGRQAWLILGAPMAPRRVLWAKFLVAYLPLLALGGAMLLGLTLIAGMDWAFFLGTWLLQALIGLGVTGIGVGLGAAFPRLDAEKARQPVSTGAGCIYMPALMVYTLTVVALLTMPPLLGEILLRAGIPALVWVLWVVGPLVAVALTALALWLPLKIGADRLAALELQ